MYKFFASILIMSLLLSGCDSESSSSQIETITIPQWERCYDKDYKRYLFRMKVNGGWFVYMGQSNCFIPDPGHKWENDKNWLANTATIAQESQILANVSPEWF